MRYLLTIIFLANWSTAPAQPPVAPERFHLYVLAGQSNMAGRGTVAEEDREVHPRAWALDSLGQWVPAREPLHFDKPAIVGVGPGLAFGKAMAEADTGVIIGLIPCAVGGSAIGAWRPGGYHSQTGDYPYDEALARVALVRHSGVLKGILWQQGESDSGKLPERVYSRELRKLVRRWRRDLAEPDLPFVAGTLPAFFVEKNPGAADINRAVLALPRRVKNTAAVSTEDLIHKGDEVHFDSPSARQLGRRFARELERLTKKIK